MKRAAFILALLFSVTVLAEPPAIRRFVIATAIGTCHNCIEPERAFGAIRCTACVTTGLDDMPMVVIQVVNAPAPYVGPFAATVKVEEFPADQVRRRDPHALDKAHIFYESLAGVRAKGIATGTDPEGKRSVFVWWITN